MALTKYNFNSFDVTPVASRGLAFDADADGFTTATPGAMALISTNTISSGVATVSIASSIDSTYDTYMFKFINIHPATDNVNFTVNFRDGSTAYDATKTTTFFQASNDESTSDGSVNYEAGRDVAQATGVQMLHSGVGADADQCISGVLHLFSPSNTTFVKQFIYTGNNTHSSNASIQQFAAGYCNVTAAIDGVQFAMSSGNIDSGVIKMYGISK
tara:strand:+ start:130 stop:774 length:645 start_codon:yes stop_codon:yes gene_type:complete